MTTMRPSWMIRTRSQTMLTSGRMCVERITVWSPPSPRMICRVLHHLPRVDADGRLIQHQHRRLMENGLRDADALPVPLGELAYQGVRVFLKSAGPNTSSTRARDARLAHPAQLTHVMQVLAHGHVRIQRHGLRQIADGRAAASGSSCTSCPATTAVPAVGGVKPVMIRMVVVFPAPFGPRKPITSPGSAAKGYVLYCRKIAIELC